MTAALLPQLDNLDLTLSYLFRDFPLGFVLERNLNRVFDVTWALDYFHLDVDDLLRKLVREQVWTHKPSIHMRRVELEPTTAPESSATTD